MSEKLNTSRWNKFVSILTSKTRFARKDVQILEDEQKDCSVVIHQEQVVRARTTSIEGTGKSGVQLAADKSELASLAEQERQRLQDSLPSRIGYWLSKAPRDAQAMPKAGDLDSDVRAFGINSACPACQATGHIPCRDGKCNGTVVCDDCEGRKKFKCSICDGKKAIECTDCDGAGNKKYFCVACQGLGKYQCTALGCSGGRIRCGRCDGRGRVEVQGYIDIGKGPTYGSQLVDCPSCRGGTNTCSSCNGIEQTCTSCNGNNTKTCISCSGDGTLACNNCDPLGLEDCGRCKASGRVQCEECRGTTKLDCKPCGAQGWTHVKAKIFTTLLLEQRIEHGAETPAHWRKAMEEAIGLSNASAVGNFALDSEALVPGTQVSLSRTWKGTVPAWSMLASVNGTEANMYAIGLQEALVDADFAVDSILTADRTKVIDAATRGGFGAQIAIQNYLSSDDHAKEVLLYQKIPNANYRTDVRSAFEIIQAHVSRMERQDQIVAWALYAVTPLPLVLFLLNGTRFRYDWIVTLAWPVAVACVQMFLKNKVIPRRLAQFTKNKSFTKSWFEHARTKENASDTPARRGWIKYLALSSAALILLLSPGQPKWMVEPLSQVHMWLAQSKTVQAREQSHTDELESWLRCDARREETLLATLKGLEKEGAAKTSGPPSAHSSVFGQMWFPNRLELAGRPVRSITYYSRPKVDQKARTKIEFEVDLDASFADFRPLVARLQPQAAPMQVPSVGALMNIMEAKHGDYSWSARFRMTRVYKDRSNYLLPEHKRPSKPSAFTEMPTIVVTCTRFSDEWLRLSH